MVRGLDSLKVDLGGSWKINAAPPAEFWKLTKLPAEGWKTAEVPSELAMQGLEVKKDQTVAFWRQFSVPASWQGHRAKLKCDAIFNDATVWINGHKAGSHVGCFTPFELDVTDLVQIGEPNVIAVAVRWDEAVDKFPWASSFVGHNLCGILRKIYLFAVPEVNVTDCHVLTTFDKNYRDASLTARVQIANDSPREISGLSLRLGLRGRHETRDAVVPITAEFPEIPAGRTIMQEIQFTVPAPRKWDAEHPNLYDLNVEVRRGENVLERTVQRVGFRQVEIRGNRVFINNMPVKYHGVVWHEADPFRGRCLSGDMWRKEMQLLRAMNCNYIRFQCVGSPPPEELVAACDEVGMFLEDELPVCWGSGSGPKDLALTLQGAFEMLLGDRSQPSVILWSLGNEMSVDQNLLIAYRLFMKDLDSTRPYATDGYMIHDRSLHNGMPIDNWHYTPTEKVTSVWAKSPIPILQGEWGHPASYNRQEAYTDPGIRDIWAYGVADKWNKMFAAQGCLGGSIWCGIDDIHWMPDGTFTGWGEYGMIDCWRREKPEYWHFKKIFTPVYIADKNVPAPEAGRPLRIPVENRHSFSDLKEIHFDWSLGPQRGTAAASVPPGAKGVLEIPVNTDASGRTLELKAYNAEGLMLDAWRIAIGAAPSPLARSGRGAGGEGSRQRKTVQLLKSDSQIAIRCGNTAWEIDRPSGMIVAASSASKNVAIRGPTLMVLPLSGEMFNIITSGRMPDHMLADPVQEQWFKSPKPITSPCTQWKATSVVAKEVADGVEVLVSGEYKEAAGKFALHFTDNGELRVSYDFSLKEALMQHPKGKWVSDLEYVHIKDGMIAPRQIGLVFDMPKEIDTLAWRRNAQWSYYPEDHIGRPEGRAKAFPGTPICKETSFYREQPHWPWSQDCNPLGSADFRSTKVNIYEASLTGSPGTSLAGVGLHVLSDGSQHVRAWIEDQTSHLLVANHNCEGCLAKYFVERMFPNPSFKPGDSVTGAVRVNILGAPSTAVR